MSLSPLRSLSHGARVSLAASLALLGACSLGTDVEDVRPLYAQLQGAKMRPRPTGVTGSAAVLFYVADNIRVTYDVQYFGVDSATSLTLHLGGSAVTSAAIATLISSPSGTSGTGAVAARTPLNPSSVTAAVPFDSVLAAMTRGDAYVVLHTKAFPEGAIRGQVTEPFVVTPPERYESSLTGANERPTPVTTSATGNAYFEGTAAELRYLIRVQNIDSVTAAHIHAGAASVAGPIVVELFSSPGTGAVNGNLTSGGITSDKVTGVTMDSLLVLMRTGGAYVNVHTKRNPDGTIRGQISPATTLPVTVP